MAIDTQETITELSRNLREALVAGELELASKINNKINQLIEYSTKIKA